MKELGFEYPLASYLGNKHDENEDFEDKTYRQRIGFHNYLENDKFKIHVIFSEDRLNLIVKCNQKNRKLFELMEKYFEFFN